VQGVIAGTLANEVCKYSTTKHRALDLYDEVRLAARDIPESDNLLSLQAAAATNLCFFLGRGDTERIMVLYDELKKLAEAHPDKPLLKLRQAQAAVNVCNHLERNAIIGGLRLAIFRDVYELVGIDRHGTFVSDPSSLRWPWAGQASSASIRLPTTCALRRFKVPGSPWFPVQTAD
jgi:hypothetical protein